MDPAVLGNWLSKTWRLPCGGSPVIGGGVDLGDEEFDLRECVDLVLVEAHDFSAGLGGAPDRIVGVEIVRQRVGGCRSEGLVVPDGFLELLDTFSEPVHLVGLADVCLVGVLCNLLGFAVEVLAEFGGLVAVVEEFDGLFEAECDKKADGDGGDVDEEVAPGVGRMVGRVDVEHGGGFLERR